MKLTAEITKAEAEEIIAEHFRKTGSMSFKNPVCTIEVGISYVGYGHAEAQEAVMRSVKVTEGPDKRSAIPVNCANCKHGYVSEMPMNAGEISCNKLLKGWPQCGGEYFKPKEED
jgi:hypothetical protein